MPRCVIPGCERFARYDICRYHFGKYSINGKSPKWVGELRKCEYHMRKDDAHIAMSYDTVDEVGFEVLISLLRRADYRMWTRRDCNVDGIPLSPYDSDSDNALYLEANQTVGVGDKRPTKYEQEMMRKARCLETETEYKITREEVEEIVSWGCLACGTHHARRLRLAHDIAVSRGGETSFDNCFCLCAKCNKQMKWLSLKEWRPDLIPELKRLRRRYNERNRTVDSDGGKRGDTSEADLFGVSGRGAE